ncbi:MAG TPA: PfkB family carbohydrate kinase [Solirubrobacteraceae bacterium]
MKAGVLGHVEWVDFAVVDRLPEPGAILHAREHFAEVGGGGAVAAVQMRRLVGAATFLTAIGDDRFGADARERLREHGVDAHAAVRERPQRRCFTYLDAGHERTITVLSARLVPHRDDPLPWELLGELDAVYVTGGDAAAIRAARAARVVVATPRALPALAEAHVELDALVASANDPGERVAHGLLDPPPRLVVGTRGGAGGEWTAAEGRTGTWRAAALPGEPVDSYGAGDTFAAALTLALGAGLAIDDALAYAARCGATCMTGRGPYGADVSAIGPPA